MIFTNTVDASLTDEKGKCADLNQFNPIFCFIEVADYDEMKGQDVDENYIRYGV